jgi:hypothetical protein
MNVIKMNVFKNCGVNKIVFFSIQIKIFTTREKLDPCGGRPVMTDKKAIDSKHSHTERRDKS